MGNVFLKDNPFYILEVSPTDKRASIINKAEEKAFFIDSNAAEEAQAKLLNPAKRLQSEVDWFLDATKGQIQTINDSINQNKTIGADGLVGMSKLNAILYNFVLSSYDDYYEMGYAILEIDEQFCELNPSSLAETINVCRKDAGVLPVNEEEVERELNSKRDQIRQIISSKVQQLGTDEYIEFVTMLAEKCIADEDYEDGIIISDMVDQYELKMQAEIESSADEITAKIEKIKTLSNKESIESNVAMLVRQIKAWDALVQPLQLKSMASGVTHRISEDVAYEARELALWLHNERGMTQASLSFVEDLKDVFAEIGSYAEIFEKDSSDILQLVNEEKELQGLVDGLKEVQEILDRWTVIINNRLSSNTITRNDVDGLIEKVKQLNSRIKASGASAELLTQLRQALCFMVRERAVSIHNDLHKTDLALLLSRALLAEFGDISEIKTKLSEDVNTLNVQLLQINQAYRGTQSQSNNSGCLIRLVIIGIIAIIIAIASSTPSKSSTSSNTTTTGTKPSYSQTSSRPVSTPAVETCYSSSSEVGSDVYVDIVSIFPGIGIYREGSTNYSHFVCECTTSSGSTVWIYMTTSEYKNNFDSGASTSIYNEYADEVTFSSRRIHGEVMKADNVMSGLSYDTGSKVINFDSAD